jgi:hypothetical protein
MGRPVLFLDFDGVLNTPGTWGKRPAIDAVDADKVQRLNALAEKLDADIVISSSWRYIHGLEELRSILVAKGLASGARVIDMTPGAADTTADWRRGDEVSAWLARLIRRPAFAIIDDMTLEAFEGLGRHLITTDGSRGLTDSDCEQIERCISRQLLAGAAPKET